MPLYGHNIYENEMYQAIENLFNSAYQKGYSLRERFVFRPYAKMNDIPDIIYIRASNQIHVVEAKRYAADMYDAIDHQLRRYRGNFNILHYLMVNISTMKSM